MRETTEIDEEPILGDGYRANFNLLHKRVLFQYEHRLA